MSEDLHHLSEAENESFVPLRSSVLPSFNFKTESGSRVGMFCKRLRRDRANQHDRDSLQITKIKITTRTRDDLPAIRYLFPFFASIPLLISQKHCSL